MTSYTSVGQMYMNAESVGGVAGGTFTPAFARDLLKFAFGFHSAPSCQL